MESKGITLFDAIIANTAAASAITSFVPTWDLVGEAHVPLQVSIEIQRLSEIEIIQNSQGKVRSEISEVETDLDTAQANQQARAKHWATFDKCFLE